MRKSLLKLAVMILVVVVLSLGVTLNAKQKKPKSSAPAATPAPATTPDEVKYISAADVKAAFDKGGTMVSGDGRNYKVIGGKHDTPGKAELHTRDTDVFYVVDGTATFVTGGKIVNPKMTGPEEVRGDSIEGGDEHQLTKGDVITIPAGTPHWFKSVQVPPTVFYFVVKIRQTEDHPYPGAAQAATQPATQPQDQPLRP
jgi:mannose-6-phosphate isomerase-like protein (cupin superfamily)